MHVDGDPHDLIEAIGHVLQRRDLTMSERVYACHRMTFGELPAAAEAARLGLGVRAIRRCRSRVFAAMESA